MRSSSSSVRGRNSLRLTVPSLMAFSRLHADSDVVPVYSPHPGDKTDHAIYRGKGIRVIPKAEMPSLELLGGADMVVNTLSTLSYESAVMQVPAICYCPDGSAIEKARIDVFGSEGVHPPEVEEGSMLLAIGPHTLKADLNRLIRNGNAAFAPLRRRQAELYPGWQVSGTAVKIMADTIEEMLRPVAVGI